MPIDESAARLLHRHHQKINGTRLADRSETAAEQTQTQTSLGGVSVLIGGEQCGLLSVPSDQIVAVVPPDASVNTTLHLVVIRGDRMSLPVSLLVTQPAPASSSSHHAR